MRNELVQQNVVDEEAIVAGLGYMFDRKRYDESGKRWLAHLAQRRWGQDRLEEGGVEFGRLNFIAPTDTFNVDEVKSGLPTLEYLRIREQIEAMPWGERKAVFFQMLEGEHEIDQLSDLLAQVQINQGMLVTSFTPGNRMDRAVDDWGGQALNPTWKRHFRNLAAAKISRMVLVDGHSPGLVQMAMEEGVSVLDLSANRLLFRGFEQRLARLNGQGKLLDFEWAAAYGDEGAREKGSLTRRLIAQERGVEHGEVLLVPGKKSKTAGIKVEFEEEALTQVEGKVVILPDDIMSSGGTLVESVRHLLEAKAEHVVILVSHALCLEGSVDKLGEFGDEITFVTTNGRSSYDDVDRLGSVVRVDVAGALRQLVQIERQGVDWWDEAGQEMMRALGFDLNPWQTEHGEWWEK